MTATTWGSPMIDPNASDPSLGTPGLIGGVLAAGLALFLGLRKYLSNDSVTTAANSAQTELINMLRQQVQLEHDRADKAEASRDSAVAQISELRLKVEALTAEVQALRNQAGHAQA